MLTHCLDQDPTFSDAHLLMAQVSWCSCFFKGIFVRPLEPGSKENITYCGKSEFCIGLLVSL